MSGANNLRIAVLKLQQVATLYRIDSQWQQKDWASDVITNTVSDYHHKRYLLAYTFNLSH